MGAADARHARPAGGRVRAAGGQPARRSGRRPLYVYRPPGVELDHPRPLPSVYVIQGYTGQLDMWFNRQPFEPTMIERLDAMFAAGECPDAIVVFVDCWTSFGGSQYLNSSSLGRYQDYLCDEVGGVRGRALPDGRRPRPPRHDRQVVRRLRRDGGADDAPGRVRRRSPRTPATRCSRPANRRSFPEVARKLRDDFEGSFDVFFERLAGRRIDLDTWIPLEMYGYAAAYSPDPATRARRCCRSTSRPAGWSTTSGRSGSTRTRCGWRPRTRTRCARCGACTSTPERDEYFLDLGAQAFAAELEALGVPTRSSCSTASTAGSRTATRARSGSWCSRSPGDRAVAVQAPGLDGRPRAEAGLGVQVPGALQDVDRDAERLAVQRAAPSGQ